MRPAGAPCPAMTADYAGSMAVTLDLPCVDDDGGRFASAVPRPAMKTRRRILVIACIAAVVLSPTTAACTTHHDRAGPAPSTRSQPPSGTSENPIASPTATASRRPPGTEVGWRGAAIRLTAGWRKALQDDVDVSLCLLPETAPDSYCRTVHGSGASQHDWVLFYAADRHLAGDPGLDRNTFSGSDMGSPGYDSAPRPCDATNVTVLRRGNGSLGGRTSMYSKFQVTCKAGQGGTYTSQRWLLPASRLGVISYALTPARADEIEQLVSNVDLTAFQPTRPT
jgi:hypothetical protein